MKVGILTYHDTRNYGAVLQAYALQKTIEALGCECEIIDYRCKAITERYKIKKINELKSLKELIKHILGAKSSKETQIKFDEFNKNFQKISKEVYEEKNIEEANSKYDIFIVGSDQVWNLNLSGKDYTYMLNFVDNDKKKNSYAASFGYKEIPTEYISSTNELVSKFNKISVREKQGKKIIEENLKRDVEVVLDPTLLLKKKQWEKISKYEERKKDYILLYIIALTPSLIEFANRLAKEKDCDIVYLNHSYKTKMGMENIRNASPEEFLGYLQNAKYVVTSSFHGVVFSINFEKEFFFELSKAKENFNSRLENIVDILKLRDREIVNGNNNSINKNIDYKKVNILLENERKKSMQFINKMLVESNE